MIHKTLIQRPKDNSQERRQQTKIENLLLTAQVLDKLGIRFWLSCGVLLGYYRENNLILHDRDLDIGIWDADYTPAIQKAMCAAGFEVWRNFGILHDGYEEAYRRNGIKIDCFYHIRTPTSVYMTVMTVDKTGQYTIPKKYIFDPFDLRPTTFLKHKFLIPDNPGHMIQQQYGDTWQIRIPDWRYNLHPKNLDKAADMSYWDDYYKRKVAPEVSSAFADVCLPYCKANSRILELGCGNGRDSVYLVTSGGQVTACDQASIPLQYLAKSHPNINWVHTDITHLPDTLPANHYDIVYSRFVLHSLNSVGEQRVLTSAYNRLVPGGKLFLEVRTADDPNFGKGIKISANEFYDTHYRRFIDPAQLRQRLLSMKFNLDLCECKRGWAVTANEDPAILRIIATKGVA